MFCFVSLLSLACVVSVLVRSLLHGRICPVFSACFTGLLSAGCVSCTPISFTQSRLFFTVSACVCQSILCLCLCSGIFLLLDSILVCAWRLGCLRALVDFCCRSPVCCLCGCFSVYIYLLSPILCLHFSSSQLFRVPCICVINVASAFVCTSITSSSSRVASESYFSCMHPFLHVSLLFLVC